MANSAALTAVLLIYRNVILKKKRFQNELVLLTFFQRFPITKRKNLKRFRDLVNSLHSVFWLSHTLFFSALFKLWFFLNIDLNSMWPSMTNFIIFEFSWPITLPKLYRLRPKSIKRKYFRKICNTPQQKLLLLFTEKENRQAKTFVCLIYIPFHNITSHYLALHFMA